MSTHEENSGGRVVLGPEFADALQYAANLHSDQTRKGSTIPYIGHLLQVAGIVIDEGGDRDTAIAALLHDAAEDRGGRARLDDIARRFGDNVASIVSELSDTLEEEKGPWRPRKEAYIEHISTCSRGALLVSIADKLHNASAIVRDWHLIGDEVWQRFSASRNDTLWYYQTLLQAYRERAEEFAMQLYILRYLEAAVSEMARIIEEGEN